MGQRGTPLEVSCNIANIHTGCELSAHTVWGSSPSKTGARRARPSSSPIRKTNVFLLSVPGVRYIRNHAWVLLETIKRLVRLLNKDGLGPLARERQIGRGALDKTLTCAGS